MAKKDPRVDAYIAKSAPFARPILKHLRKVVHAGCPDVVETIKWGSPHFDHKGSLAGMAAFKEHVTFGFWKSALLMNGKTSLGKSEEKAMGQFGRVASIRDLPAERTLVALVKKAAQLNEDGIKVARVRTPKPALPTPADLLAALRRNKRARDAFEAFSPSQKREYVEWITEAKTDATRERRLKTAVEWMAEGKIRNWKYARA